MNQFPYGRAICYSGYRKNQSPHTKVYPSYNEILEDLKILENDFDYIRMYDPSEHAKTALKVIREQNIDLKVMLGIDLLGEESNPQCSWGGDYSEEEVQRNIQNNEQQLQDLILLANQYEDIIISVSAGNEAVPEWNENLVQPKRVLYFVNELKKHTNQLVTYCENNNYWKDPLKEVAEAVDFISIHSYPIWVNLPIEEAYSVTLADYEKVQNWYPHKQVIITEAGWPTTANGGGFQKEFASEENQVIYFDQMKKWSEENQITLFFFEAFDEPWKGSENPLEPEKHWGIYFEDRSPKKVKK